LYFPSFDNAELTANEKSVISFEVIEETYKTIRQETIELINQALVKSPDTEQLKKIAVKLTLDHADFGYTILANYHPNCPFEKELEELILTTPLVKEIKYLKQRQSQMPTSENFNKLDKQKKLLTAYLQECKDESSYRKIEEKVDKLE